MGARILVADDSVTIQKVVELTFSREDFELIQARNGDEAVRKAREQRPDLILLDLVMPGKSGYEVCEILRADPALAQVPIILLAGTFESLDRDRGKAVGADDFVHKPFESQALISKVKQLLFSRVVDQAVAPPPPAVAPVPVVEPAVPQPLEAATPVIEPQVHTPAPPAESHDQLWELLETGQSPPPPSAVPEEPALDLTALDARLDLDLLADAAPPSESPPPAAPDLEPLALPGPLWLEDLLAEPAFAGAFQPGDRAAAVPLDVSALAGEPDPGEGLGLAAVEPAEAAAPALELDLSHLADVLQAESAEAPPAAAPFAPVLEEARGELPFIPTLELPELEPAAAVELPAFEAEVPLQAVEAREEAPPVSIEVAAAPVESGARAPAVAEAPAGEDLEAMRQAVTSRVAEALAKELSQKLMERIERVVWEVVPDLAEILIAKEIERIRQLAEPPKAS